MTRVTSGYVSRAQARRWLLGWLIWFAGTAVCLETSRRGHLNLLAALVAVSGVVVAISGQGGWAWRIEKWRVSDYARRAQLPVRSTVAVMWTGAAAVVVAAVNSLARLGWV